MPINNTLLNIGGDAMAAAAEFLSIHTAEPDGSGSNESTADRQEAGWGAAEDGNVTATNIEFTGGASGGPATHVGKWSAAEDGTFYGWTALSGDQTFNAAGEYTITSISLDGEANGAS